MQNMSRRAPAKRPSSRISVLPRHRDNGRDKAIAWVLGLCALMACQSPAPPLPGPTKTNIAPGSSGNAVLWIQPEVASERQNDGSPDDAAIATIITNPGETDDDILSLRELLQSGTLRVRNAVVDALQDAPAASARLGLLVAAADPHPMVAEAAMTALLDLSINERDALFTEAIESSVPLAALGAAQHWTQLIAEPMSSPVAARIATSLRACQHPAAKMALYPCKLKSARPIVTATTGDRLLLAAHEACRLRETTDAAPIQSIPELVEALRHEDLHVRRFSAAAVAAGADRLSSNARETALLELARARNTVSPLAAIAIAWARAKLGEADGITTLAIYLRVGEETVRVAALDALIALISDTRRLQRPELYPALQKARLDEDTAVRRRVAQVAGALNDGRVMELLAQLITDKAPEVRAAAALALARNGRLEPAAPYLIDLVTSDLDRDVLDAAYMALEHLVHGHPLSRGEEIGRFLDAGGASQTPFFGRDALRWRRWFQSQAQ